MKKLVSLILCFAVLFSFAACGKETEEEIKDYLTLDNGNISIVSLQVVSGLFVEKGNQDNVENVAALVVKNNSEKMLEYSVISFRVNTYERAEFTVSALPAGESVLVMESLARPFSVDDEYTLADESTIFSYCDASIVSDKAELQINGSEFNLTNKTDLPLNATVVYKYYQNGMYYGGIAFRGNFEDIKPHETKTEVSSRFNENCKVVNFIVE